MLKYTINKFLLISFVPDKFDQFLLRHGLSRFCIAEERFLNFLLFWTSKNQIFYWVEKMHAYTSQRISENSHWGQTAKHPFFLIKFNPPIAGKNQILNKRLLEYIFTLKGNCRRIEHACGGTTISFEFDW